jgi:hypothetical protein
MAQTLKFGNGTWATKKDSILAYNDQNENYKPLPFNYTGAGKGTRVNKEGLIEVVENDRPRIDYLDSEDGVFLLEKAATNLVTYSEDFISSWNKENLTVTSNEIISPNGILSADKLIENETNTYHALSRSINISLGNNSISVFAKKDERKYLIIRSNLSGSNVNTTFDLENGLVTYNGHTSSSIQSFGNGWYRCAITSSSSTTNVSTAILMSEVNVTSNTLITYQGDGTSGVYVWGFQVESGNLSSYIPTQGTIQTRVQETASGSGNSEVFNDSEGVLYANISALADDGTNRVLTLSNGGYSNSIRIQYYTTSNQLEFRVVSSGSAVVLQRFTISDVTLFNKILVKYKLNDFAMWVNGFEVLTDTSGATPVGLNEVRFDDGDGNVPFYGKTKEISYYDEILTDLELETLTSYRTWESMVKELNLNVIYNG